MVMALRIIECMILWQAPPNALWVFPQEVLWQADPQAVQGSNLSMQTHHTSIQEASVQLEELGMYVLCG